MDEINRVCQAYKFLLEKNPSLATYNRRMGTEPEDLKIGPSDDLLPLDDLQPPYDPDLIQLDLNLRWPLADSDVVGDIAHKDCLDEATGWPIIHGCMKLYVTRSMLAQWNYRTIT